MMRRPVFYALKLRNGRQVTFFKPSQSMEGAGEGAAGVRICCLQLPVLNAASGVQSKAEGRHLLLRTENLKSFFPPVDPNCFRSPGPLSRLEDQRARWAEEIKKLSVPFALDASPSLFLFFLEKKR